MLYGFFDCNHKEIKLGDVIAEGKTKIIRRIVGEARACHVESKDDTTAFNAKKHAVIPGKGALSNELTCYVFEMYRKLGIPIAYYGPYDERSFLATLCAMLPIEATASLVAFGSFQKRNPHIPLGTALEHPAISLFLKTSGQKWEDIDLPCDDPYLTYAANVVSLWLPSKPINDQKPIARFLMKETVHFAAIRALITKEAGVLARCYEKAGVRLVDFKREYGLDSYGRLRGADIYSPDECRVVEVPEGRHFTDVSAWRHLDKEYFRSDEYVDARNDPEFIARYTRHAQIGRTFIDQT